MLPWPASTRPKTISLQHSSQGPFNAFIMMNAVFMHINKTDLTDGGQSIGRDFGKPKS